MKNLNQTVCLLIGGTCIKIHFEACKNDYFYSVFMKEWKHIFGKYIVHEIVCPTPYVITVTEDANLQFHKENKKITLTVAFISRKKISTFYHLGIKQFCRIVDQLVFNEVIKNKGIYLHGSAVQTNHGAVIFLGKSGAGKSTISSLLSPEYPVLADDQLFIVHKDNNYYFYQSFIPESNSSILPHLDIIPLWRLFFLKKSFSVIATHILSKSEVYRNITPQLFTTPDDAHISNRNLVRFIKREDIFYTYSFPKNKKVVISSFLELTK